MYTNDFGNRSNLLDFHIFADSSRSLTELEDVGNNNLKFVSNWLIANKLSLNIDKTNIIIFHPPQKSTSHVVKLLIANREIKQDKFMKYLRLHIDSHLRYFACQQALVHLYHILIYPFLTYSLITWGNTYLTSLDRSH